MCSKEFLNINHKYFLRFFQSQPGSKIGADPTLTGALTWLEWEEYFDKEDSKKLSLIRTIPNPIDEVWQDQPSRSQDKLEVHDTKYAGNVTCYHYNFSTFNFYYLRTILGGKSV